LVPTVENYRKVPEMMKPTPSQCMIPHIGAIETIPMYVLVTEKLGKEDRKLTHVSLALQFGMLPFTI
jgi:hypothetical protein